MTLYAAIRLFGLGVTVAIVGVVIMAHASGGSVHSELGSMLVVPLAVLYLPSRWIYVNYFRDLSQPTPTVLGLSGFRAFFLVTLAALTLVTPVSILMYSATGIQSYVSTTQASVGLTMWMASILILALVGYYLARIGVPYLIRSSRHPTDPSLLRNPVLWSRWAAFTGKRVGGLTSSRLWDIGTVVGLLIGTTAITAAALVGVVLGVFNSPVYSSHIEAVRHVTGAPLCTLEISVADFSRPPTLEVFIPTEHAPLARIPDTRWDVVDDKDTGSAFTALHTPRTGSLTLQWLASEICPKSSDLMISVSAPNQVAKFVNSRGDR